MRERLCVSTVPDWPVVAARATGALPGGIPVAVTHGGIVVACDDAARRAGVRVGARVRHAQQAEPELALAPADPVGEARAFERVAKAIGEVVPGVQTLPGGSCMVRMRGARRFYGSEVGAVTAITAACDALGIRVQLGVADDRFTAAIAAKHEGGHIVPPGGSASFLAPLPVEALGDDALASMLRRLGMPTLGAFAKLEVDDVFDRFGESGVHALRCARGVDPRLLQPDGERELPTVLHAFEPPAAGAQEVISTVTEGVERCVEELATRRLVVTEVRVALRDDTGEIDERTWRRQGVLRAADILDRIRWQLEDSRLTAPLAELHLVPCRIEHERGHTPALLGGEGVDDRTRAAIERLQARLGREQVLTPSTGGGRLLAERSVLTPWGDRPPAAPHGPWPGALPSPRPGTVFRPALPAVLADRDGSITSPQHPAPATLQVAGQSRPVVAWGGPWPLRIRDAMGSARQCTRMQVVTTDAAWVLLHQGDADAASAWVAEGRY